MPPGTDHPDTHQLPAGIPLFHVEHTAAADATDEISRAQSLLDQLEGQVGGGSLTDGALLGARMYAHEVNNLLSALAGRAQRAMLTQDPEHERRAIQMCVQIGQRINQLSNIFLESTDNNDDSELTRPICLCESQLSDVHAFAEWIARSSGTGMSSDSTPGNDGGGVGGGWGVGSHGLHIETMFEEGIRVPISGLALGQILINLYRNAMNAIAHSDDAAKNARIRLRVFQTPGCGRCSGACHRQSGSCPNGSVIVRVEDSGTGFSASSHNPSRHGQSRGYGLGLSICQTLCERYGGRVVLGPSDELGGARVDVVFS